MWLKDKLIASPLNYTGGKYKLLSQIIPLFPSEVNTFYDIFCGGCNVGVNVKAKKTICNDTNTHLIGLLHYLQNNSFEIIKQKIEETINKYHLSDTTHNCYNYYNCNSSAGLGAYNKTGYLKLRNEFNQLSQEDDNYYLFLFILIIFSFNNQIRFNSNGQFNLPVGKRDFNSRIQNKLQYFMSNISNITFTNASFETFSVEKMQNDDFVYADPPYLITCATYNEKGWNEDDEKKLLDYLDLLHTHHIKFALSNVLTANDKENHILTSWLNENTHYTCHHLSHSYNNANYHRKTKNGKTDEVLITNY